MPGLLEIESIVRRGRRLQAKHLDEGARVFAEVQAGADDTRVVKYHQATLGNVARQVAEVVLTHLAVLVEQEFGGIALFQRELGNALLRQIILEVADADMSGILIHSLHIYGAKVGIIPYLCTRYAELFRRRKPEAHCCLPAFLPS